LCALSPQREGISPSRNYKPMKTENQKYTSLDLKRVSSGYYERNVGEVRIQLSNPYVFLGEGSNSWQCVIEVQGDVVYNEWFRTKSDACKEGADYINQF